jgi:membrane protein
VTEILALTYAGWRDHRVTRLGASLAYYGLFALVPLVTIVVVVADVLVEFDAAIALIAQPLAELLGEDVTEVTAVLAERVEAAAGTVGLRWFGGISLLVSASLLFVSFQDALDVIWEVPVRAGLRHTVGRRLVAFGVVFGASALLILGLAVQTVVGWLHDLVADEFTAVAATVALISRLTPVLVVALALAVLFRLLPHAEIEGRAAVIGGVLAGLGIGVGVLVTGRVLERTASFTAQGAAGVVFVLLSGIYVLSQIVLVSAELTRVLSERWAATPSSARIGAAPAGDRPAVTSEPQETSP